MQIKQEAAMKRERALAYAFSHQVDVCAWCNCTCSMWPNIWPVPTYESFCSMAKKCLSVVCSFTSLGKHSVGSYFLPLDIYSLLQQLWRAPPKEPSQLYIDCEPDKPHWGWSWLERWMAARPWENRVFDNNSASKDVFDGYSYKSVDGNVASPVEASEYEPKQKKLPAKQKNLVPHSRPVRSESWTPSQGLQIVPHSSSVLSKGNSRSHSHQSSIAVHRTTSQGALQSPAPSSFKSVRPASPRSRVRKEEPEEDGSTISTTARSTPSMPIGNPQFGTRYSMAGSIRDDESLASSPAVPNYMQATQSARNKARSHSTPKQRPGTPEKDGWSSAKKRLSFPISEDLISSSGPMMRPFKPTAYPQRSPSIKGAPGPIRMDRSSVSSLGGNDSNLGDETPSSNGHSVSRPYRF